MDGLAFLRATAPSGGAALLIMMSAYGDEDAALAAMREGAYDYLPSRSAPTKCAMPAQGRRAGGAAPRGDAAARELGAGARCGDLVVAEPRRCASCSSSPSRVARHNTTVLITGESGTGKELLARAIHRRARARARAFIAINCAAIPEHLLESELFGQRKGAFTGATADRAGLFERRTRARCFLDEIGDLPLALQAKLLRVLEEGEIRRVGGARVAQGGRAGRRGHRQAARAGGRAGRVPRRPVLPPQRRAPPPPAAARAAGGRSGAARPLRPPGCDRGWATR